MVYVLGSGEASKVNQQDNYFEGIGSVEGTPLFHTRSEWKALCPATATRGPRQASFWPGGVESRGPRQASFWLGGVQAGGRRLHWKVTQRTLRIILVQT